MLLGHHLLYKYAYVANRRITPVKPTITPHKMDNVIFCRYDMRDKKLSITRFNLVDMVFSVIRVISCFVHKYRYYFFISM